jgi:hypothetical protein
MNVKKIKVDEVKDGSVKFEVCKKEFVKCVKEMETAYNDFDNMVTFYACLDQEFDQGKTTNLLFLLGKRKPEWKPFVNGQLKDGKEKKKVLIGNCYLEIKDGKKILQLSPTKGAAKLSKLIKGGKTLFKKAGVTLAIPGDLAREEDEETVVENENTKKEVVLTPNQKVAKKLKNTWAEIAKISVSLKTIKEAPLKAQALYKLHDLNKFFVNSMIKYNELEGDNNATENLLPGIAMKAAALKKRLDENSKNQAIFKLGDSFKKRVKKLNSLLNELDQPRIKV